MARGLQLKWFKHDSDATTDARVKKLILKYGAEGYAIYFHCIELIVGDTSETNVTFELEHDAEIIADNLKIKGTADMSGVDRVNEIMRYIIALGLFTEDNGHVRCYKIARRIDSSMTSNQKLRGIIAKSKSHDGVMTRHDKLMQEEIRREGEEKEIRREENIGPASAVSTTKFSKPTLDQVAEYCQERGNTVDPQRFIDHYESVGWKVGRSAMKDWRASVRTWEKNEKPVSKPKKRLCDDCGTELLGTMTKCHSCGSLEYSVK